MKTIHKAVLSLQERQQFYANADIKFLKVDSQSGQFCVWYETEVNDINSCYHVVRIVGTGQIVPHNATQYLGTVQDGPMVWHFYLETN